MKILLSPAKSLDYSKSIDKPFVNQPSFLKETEQLVGKLKKIKPKKFMEMMHISSDLAHLNYDRYQAWISPTEENEHVKACIEVFNGEVYKGLDPFTWNETELIRANEQIRILSGLYGILKPFDIVSPYRLEIGLPFAPSNLKKNLYVFWQEKIHQFLTLNLVENDVLVNLASQEYAKVLDFKNLGFRTITPIFKEYNDGNYKMVMMYAKNARGKMARFIVKNDIQNLADLRGFDEDGYVFKSSLSSETQYVFMRLLYRRIYNIPK